jgi:NAD(P)-dependent dehydrogenase (short-subunit alcohol dehydrogenase family)
MQVLEGQVAIVTGGGTGIGRSTALMLAAEGARVVIAGRRKPPLDEVVAEVERAGGVCAARVADLGRAADAVDLARWSIERFGRIDVLVNNGRYIGPGHMDPFEETPVELIEQMMLCNVVAPLNLIKLCVPIMKRQGGGIVINVTSSAGERETPAPIGQGGWGLGYSLSKAAFNRMVPGLAKELREHGIAVIGLMPGFVGTERMAAELAEFGFDASKALPVENPGRVCAMLATAKDPLYFSGKDIYGPAFHAEHANVRFEV